MGGIGEGYKLEVAKWNVIENGLVDCDEDGEQIVPSGPKVVYAQTNIFETGGGGEFSETIIKESNSIITEFEETYYCASYMVMYNLETILVDDRVSWGIKHGATLYNIDSVDVTTFKIKQKDKKTGEIIYETTIDSIPNVLHDVKGYEKDHFIDKDETKVLTDKVQLLEIINNGAANIYEIASEELKNDPKVVDTLLEAHYYKGFYLVPDKYIRDKEYILKALKYGNNIPWHRYDKEFKKEILSDNEFLKKAREVNERWFENEFSYQLNQFNKPDEIKKKKDTDSDDKDMPF